MSPTVGRMSNKFDKEIHEQATDLRVTVSDVSVCARACVCVLEACQGDGPSHEH